MPAKTPANHKPPNTTLRLIALCTTVGVCVVLEKNFVSARFIACELVASLSTIVAAKLSVNRIGTDDARGRVPLVLGILILPFLAERVCRASFHVGLPLEATILCSVRNATLLPLLFPKDQRWQSVGASASLVAMLAIYLQDNSLTTSIVVFCYFVFGILWLIARYWTTLQQKAASDSQRMIPRTARLGVVIFTLLLALIGSFFVQATNATTAIAGFMPSSGGTGRSDPYAFRGIGDGEQLVKATDSAKSVGPLESELFLESKMPSIYDVFNDVYMDPSKPKKTTQAIPLSPTEVRTNHQRLAQNEVASREFTATRSNREKSPLKNLDDLQSNALFYVHGRVPAHLKHEVYNTWDGTTLSFDGEATKADLTLTKQQQTPWVYIASGPTPDTATEQHVIRFSRMKTDRVPSPPSLRAVSLDKLHMAEFFSWTNDGVLCFASGGIPRMTVLHVQSQPPMQEVVEQIRLKRDEVEFDAHLDPAVLRSLHSWTRGASTDWQKITSVVNGIQQTCRFDASASISETETDVVNEFLLTRQQGPDYLFAIAAARLFRAIGYRAQVISGFYANPDNYDRESDQTAVLPNDVHFWVEVQAKDGSWIIVEPSPGYRVRYGRLSFWQQVARCKDDAFNLLWRLRSEIVCVITGLVLIVVYRWRIYCHLLQFWWLLPLQRSERRVVRLALSVLDARARLRGNARRPEITVQRWLANEFQQLESAASLEFQRLVQWALYASPGHAPVSMDPKQICHEVLTHTSIGKLNNQHDEARG